VLAAVKHESTDEEHIRLNHRITRCAQEFADAYGSDAHFVTAFVDRNHPPDAYLMSDALGAPLEHIHIGEGDASSVISHTAEEINADLVVIGTVSRGRGGGQHLGACAGPYAIRCAGADLIATGRSQRHGLRSASTGQII
jgi:universal stress protein E